MFGRGRRESPSKDWFTCPVCGADVPVGARACRECGSDETTGWSEATQYDDLDLPEPERPEIPDTFEEFTRAARPRRRTPVWIALGLLALAIALVLANAVLVALDDV
ncbi:MAG: zinc ribbon domain-containing protein [Planctomycetota bacterium]